MTLIVGVRCEEGVVIAADSRATLGLTGVATAGQNISKLIFPAPGVIVGISGHVGLGQKLLLSLEDYWPIQSSEAHDQLKTRNSIREKMIPEVVSELRAAQIAQPAVGPQAALSSAICTTFVALPVEDSPTLLLYDHQCGVEEITISIPFSSIGSGQTQADPFLSFLKKSLWADKAPKKVADGHLAAIWTLDHVIEYHPGGGVGGNVAVATLQKKGSEWVVEEMPKEMLDFHRQNIEGALDVMGEYLDTANTDEEQG